MLIPLGRLIEDYNLRIRGVLHLGAHLGEEAETYSDLDCEPVYWVEANPDLMPRLQTHVDQFYMQFAYEALVTDKAGEEVTFHVTKNLTTPRGQLDHMSSSILKLGTHRKSSPYVKPSHDITCISTTVDLLVEENGMEFNFMNLDLQGAELLALHGARHTLDGVDAIYTEVNNKQVYQGCAQVGELDEFLALYDMVRVETEWASPTAGWGDALYVRDGVGYL